MRVLQSSVIVENRRQGRRRSLRNIACIYIGVRLTPVTSLLFCLVSAVQVFRTTVKHVRRPHLEYFSIIIIAFAYNCSSYLFFDNYFHSMY